MLEEIAAGRTGATVPRVALNRLVRKAGVASVIVGARTDGQLVDNLAAASWSLTDAEVTKLDKVSANRPRYPYIHHRLYGADRNPLPSLLPRLPVNA